MKIRKAIKEDIPSIINLLADDKLGVLREKNETPLPDCYLDAFENINSETHQELIVMEDTAHEVIGTLQLTFIQYLNYQGGLRAQIESVHIRNDQTGKGLGKELFAWAIQRAKQRGATIIQLTTDKQRPEALRFYQKIGFKDSHEGMKLHLPNTPNNY